LCVLIFSDQFAFVLSAQGKAFKSLNCARVQYILLLFVFESTENKLTFFEIKNRTLIRLLTLIFANKKS